jgi:hypothetical protein
MVICHWDCIDYDRAGTKIDPEIMGERVKGEGG